MAYLIYETKTSSTNKTFYWNGKKFLTNKIEAKQYLSFGAVVKDRNRLAKLGFDPQVTKV